MSGWTTNTRALREVWRIWKDAATVRINHALNRQFHTSHDVNIGCALLTATHEVKGNLHKFSKFFFVVRSFRKDLSLKCKHRLMDSGNWKLMTLGTYNLPCKSLSVSLRGERCPTFFKKSCPCSTKIDFMFPH